MAAALAASAASAAPSGAGGAGGAASAAVALPYSFEPYSEEAATAAALLDKERNGGAEATGKNLFFQYRFRSGFVSIVYFSGSNDQ